METFEECARRETQEECGIEIEKIRFQFLANVTQYAPKHYVHVGVVADWKSGEPQTREPDKAEEWKWYALDHLPEPLFDIGRLSIESYQTGRNYYGER